MSHSVVHHAPVGSWSSLAFGEPNKGVAICHETLGVEANADLLVAIGRQGRVTALPFVADARAYAGWDFAAAEGLARTLTACVDEFAAAAAGITLRVLTPHAALPNPRRSGNLQFATVPGILLELIVDNASDEPATAFLGIASRGAGRLRPLDWSSKTMRGVGGGAPGNSAGATRWLLAAASQEGVGTLQTGDIVAALAAGKAAIDPTGQSGGILLHVPPRGKVTLTAAFVTYQPGLATQGIDARYAYTQYFPRIEAAANFLLHNAQRMRESCASFDARVATAYPDADRRGLFSQAIRTYEAGTQVLDGGIGATGQPTAHFATIAPASLGAVRNALDHVIDFLPWELYRNPWVARNIFDLATSSYAYHDQVRFPTDAASPDQPRAGGMTFARDFGVGGSYAPGAAFDVNSTKPGWAGGNLATESLLNAIYLLTGYALVADDTPWAKTRLPFARELLTSMENRDHWDPEQRTGILKAESLGSSGNEITTFAAEGSGSLPPALAMARGNIYLAVKTFCANLLLTTYFQNNNDLHSADYSYAFAQKTAAGLVAAFDQGAQVFAANVLSPGAGPCLLAAFEPLAIPTYLGLTSTLAEYFPELHEALKAHAESCLKASPAGCLDGGALRLCSDSAYVVPSKLIHCLYVLERLFEIDVAGRAPAAWKTLAESGAAAADPRALAVSLYLKPMPAAR